MLHFHCTTPPLVLLHVVAGPAQSLSVYTFTNFEGVMTSIRFFALGAPFKYLTIRFRFISSLSVDVIFLAVSFTLYMTSARSWHMYNNFPTTVLYIARLSPSSSTSDSVVGVLHTWSHHGFCFFQTKNIYHASDVLRIRFHRVSSCRSLKHSAQETEFVTCLLHSSCDPHQNLFCQEFNQFQNFIFSVQTLTRRRHERKIFAFVSSFRKQLGSVRNG